jgi:uncharacterized membrane protein HdeD (DUF308 family)
MATEPDSNDPKTKDPVEETSKQSFPASDPPGWTATHAGAPDGQRADAMADQPDRSSLSDLMNARIARNWWAAALKGASAIALGVLALAWPGITLITLVMIFAAFCVVDAVFSTVLAVRGARHGGRWGLLALNALLGLAAAAIAIFYPGLTLLAFVVMLAAWALVTGVVTIAAAIRLKRDHGRWLMIAAGVATLVLGLALVALPPLGLLTLIWLVAIQAFVAGGTLLALAYRLRMRQRQQDGEGRQFAAS